MSDYQRSQLPCCLKQGKPSSNDVCDLSVFQVKDVPNILIGPVIVRISCLDVANETESLTPKLGTQQRDVKETEYRYTVSMERQGFKNDQVSSLEQGGE